MGDRIVVMKDGFIQQVDTPQNLYDYPVNEFVAGFMGSPQMNFIDATVGEAAGKVTLSFGGNTVTLTDAKGKVLKDKGYVSKAVTMGIRPEDVVDSNEHPADRKLSETIDATVTVYELLGSEAMIYADVDGGAISSHVSSGNPARVGSRIKVAFDLDKIHVFDKQSELAVVH